MSSVFIIPYFPLLYHTHLSFFDNNLGLRIGSFDLLVGRGRHFRFEAERPHHHNSQDPPEDLPGPERQKACKREGAVAGNTGRANGENVPQGNDDFLGIKNNYTHLYIWSR